MVPIAQIIGLVIVVGLAVWLVRRSRERAKQSYEELAPPPPEPVLQEPDHLVEPDGSDPEPVAEPNGADPLLLTESNGLDPELEAEPDDSDLDLVTESNGTGPELSDLETELREIYDRVGHPDSFPEAKDKVTALADELVERDGIDHDEALRAAYRRSLDEHNEYLAAKGLA